MSDELWKVAGADELQGKLAGSSNWRSEDLWLPRGDIASVVVSGPVGTKRCGTTLEEYFDYARPDYAVGIGQQAVVGVEKLIGNGKHFAIGIRNLEEHPSSLRAQCAATGFRAAQVVPFRMRGRTSGGTPTTDPMSSEWHRLEPTMHKLLDAGAWTMTDDRRIRCPKFTGSDQAISLYVTSTENQFAIRLQVSRQ
jgi:hypothetical protein